MSSYTIRPSPSQSKGTFGLYLDQLYELLFRNQKAELVIYGITLTVALAFAIISDFILKRPRQTVLYEGSILALLTFVSLVFGYVYGAIRTEKNLSRIGVSDSPSLATPIEATSNLSKDQTHEIANLLEELREEMREKRKKVS